MPQEVERQYKEILRQYVMRQTEQNLYAGQNFSRQLIKKNIAPEEVISIHKSALEEMFPDLPLNVWHSFDLLIEMMIRYGLAHREHQSLLEKQEEMKVEMDLAANVQETLLKTRVPNVERLDIGLISVPAKKMNGDYIYFLSDNEKHAGVAVADVIGKGIPAALCMSMVKYGMDSFHDLNANPKVVLDVINRIVEKSVTDDMFISMFYGRYNVDDSTFTYASAGHEPALFYDSEKGEFRELHAKGLLLGVVPNVDYQQYDVKMEVGDFVVMMTDGVTECRSDDGFIEQETITKMIEKMKDQPAQKIVDQVFVELEKMQHFELRDDFTLVIFKRVS
ncbi:PP2C family protein-serine/threonine phosphatase [Paenisporosarcina cavernae]|uniref:Phosphoserine phosphatase n=1 Tax=Paenisporosarcina cavernae TaxID=2320858 RepID=A0A385YU22_9BACL|nr:PP2C family protein-serine/threonine phosphatase [Paenisporosarcina cavernae]AYC30359.1 phosphoserine phosphatase [Paenisporosarcina cavernae]